MEEQANISRIRGRVKWFDPTKGFGFVVSDEGGPDILLHANVLRNFGQSSVADGAEIELNAQATARGMQAVEVLEIRAVALEPVLPQDGAAASEAELAALSPEPARVKWFDKAKGFGFANIFGQGDDIFIHLDVLRRSGLADLQPGEAICLKVTDGRRGRMAVQVMPWDAAVAR